MITDERLFSLIDKQNINKQDTKVGELSLEVETYSESLDLIPGGVFRIELFIHGIILESEARRIKRIFNSLYEGLNMKIYCHRDQVTGFKISGRNFNYKDIYEDLIVCLKAIDYYNQI